MGKLKGITINTDPAAEAHICAEDDAADLSEHRRIRRGHDDRPAM